MNKRLVIIISAIVGLLVVMAVLLGFAVRKQKPAKQSVVVAPQIKKVLDEKVISPIASFDSNAIWYFNFDGRLFRANTDGSGLSEFPLPSLSSGAIKQTLWATTGSDFIAITGSGLTQTKNYYNSTQKIYITLPKNIQSFDWLPDGKRIVYIWQSGDNQTPAGGEARQGRQQLVLADSDGSGFKAIKDVFWPDLVVKASLDGKTVLMWRSNVQDINKIYSANLETAEITTVIDQGKNLEAKWISPNRFIFTQSAITTYPKLYLFDLTTKKAVDLGMNTTLDKVVTDKDGKVLYAAVPKKDNSADTFVKMDLSNYKLETYFEPTENVRGKNLFLVGQSVYFVNPSDNKLYTISK